MANTARKGVSLSAAVGLSSILATLILLPVIVHSVGPTAYGAWLVVFAVAGYLQYADLGVGTAIVYFSARYRGSAPEAIPPTRALSAGLLWNSLIILLALPTFGAFAWLYLNSTSIASIMDVGQRSAIGALGVVAIAALLLKPFSSYLVGNGGLTTERCYQLVGVTVRFTGTLAACLITSSIVWVAVAEVVGLLAPHALAATRFLASKSGLSYGQQTLGDLRRLLSYSSRAFVANLTGAGLLQSGTLLVGWVGSPADVTYYNAAFRLYTSVRQVIGWCVDPFRPALGRASADSKSGEFSSVVLGVSYGVLVMTSVVGGAIAICAPILVRAWLGPNVPTDLIAGTATILILSLVLNAMHIPLVAATDSLGRPGAYVWIQFLWLGCYLPVAVLLGRTDLGIAGVALGFTLPLLVVEPIYLMTARRVLPVSASRWRYSVAMPVICSVAVGALSTLLLALALIGADGTVLLPLLSCAYAFGAVAVLALMRGRGGPEFLRKSLSVNL